MLHVRCCNEPLHNARTTVLNWTSADGEVRIGERLSSESPTNEYKGGVYETKFGFSNHSRCGADAGDPARGLVGFWTGNHGSHHGRRDRSNGRRPGRCKCNGKGCGPGNYLESANQPRWSLQPAAAPHRSL